ncbi:hypothetical protein NE857_27315 [Nocardiopsis exhalans]|uniref:LPXTG-motif cell wall anchor domain-containing protein n=1 Tax=Nocardiopsis exhalans TaxID=163604 RepID=A0ABY5D775_9ACTN|nr:hypothetical protein [Nocardiopsis exhalans]USY18943.1 hypothetical protein NE857_27315 [Nocardiopsis exhalans]
MFTSTGAGAFSVRLFGAVALTTGLVLGAGASASAAPGDNGTVKIHNPQTPEEDNRNEPKVCDFQVVAFGFDAGQEVSWEILTHGGPPNSRTVELEGELVLDDEGAGSTEVLNLDDGHYKLEWTFDGQKGKGGKHKVFKVVCDGGEGEPEPNPTPTGEPETPETPENPEASPTPETPETPEVPDEGKTPGEETGQPEDGPSEEAEPTTPVTEAGPGQEKDGSDLAVTGSALAGLVAAGALAAAGGGAALYMSRKRRGQGTGTEA